MISPAPFCQLSPPRQSFVAQQHFVLLCLAFLTLALLGLAAPAAARVVVINANGYTLCEQGKLVRFTTLVIGDDGRVVETLSQNTTFADLPGDTVVDARGRTVLPGLIDAHGHVMALGQQATAIDLSDTTSLADALARVRTYAAAHPGARWLLGRGWNQERWGLGRFPTAAELDGAVADRPVYLARVDGHAGWANSAAMTAARINDKSVDPVGGRILRDAAGRPNGVFVDAAKDAVEAVIPPPTAAERVVQLDTALKILASVGLTAVGDMGADPATWALYRDFDARGRLTTRIAAFAGGMKSLAAIAPDGPIGWSRSGRLSLPGVKLYGDGALGSRGAWLKADYADAPGNRGLRFHSDAEMTAMVASADARHFDIAVHAIGDAANAQALDAFAALPPAGTRHRHLHIEHAQVVDPADLPRFGALHVIASVQPTHATSDKGMAEDRLGPARLAGAYAWQQLRANHAWLAAGSDFPVEPPNPFYGLHAAVTRQDRSNQPAGGWRPQEALTLEQAFHAFTVGAADAVRADAGTLVKGQWGDFIIVDRDPFGISATDLWKVQVDETWVGGQRVFSR